MQNNNNSSNNSLQNGNNATALRARMHTCAYIIALIYASHTYMHSFAAGVSGGGGIPAHDVKTQSGLTSIFNERIVQVEHMQRPLAGGSSGSSSAGLVASLAPLAGYDGQHEGVRYIQSVLCVCVC